MSRAARTLAVAEHVSQTLEQQGVQSAIIDGMALAVHQYPRATLDFDLATDTDPFTQLREVTRILKGEGLAAELIEPDVDDPLGGVINISGSDFNPIQVVNFFNPLRPRNPLIGRATVQNAQASLIANSTLKVADLAHLIALKLYAGGVRNKGDVLELLERNPSADREHIANVCKQHGLGAAFQSLLDSADS